MKVLSVLVAIVSSAALVAQAAPVPQDNTPGAQCWDRNCQTTSWKREPEPIPEPEPEPEPAQASPQCWGYNCQNRPFKREPEPEPQPEPEPEPAPAPQASSPSSQCWFNCPPRPW